MPPTPPFKPQADLASARKELGDLRGASAAEAAAATRERERLAHELRLELAAEQLKAREGAQANQAAAAVAKRQASQLQTELEAAKADALAKEKALDEASRLLCVLYF